MIEFFKSSYSDFKDLLKPTMIAIFFLILINLGVSTTIESTSMVTLFFAKTEPFDNSDNILNLFLQFMTIATIFSYGYIIKIFTQSVINDKIKSNYLSTINDNSFEILRQEVVERLRLKAAFSKFFENHHNNDYLLYIMLSKILPKEDRSSRSYHGQVEIISHIYWALIMATSINLLWVLFLLPSSNLYYGFPIFFALVLLLILFHKREAFVVNLATKRYIARNTRLYVNYLLNND